MKNLLFVFLAVAFHATNAKLYASCGGAPAKARSATSSRGKFMGILGNASGRHCPGKELFWVPVGGSTFDLCFARGKKKPAPIDNATLAIFSPDCGQFWVSGGFADGTLKIVNAGTGKVIHTLNGTNPAWSDDSTTLYYFSGDNQVMAFDLPSATSRLVFAVSDYVSCRAPGEGAVFNPVKVLPENRLQWEYSTSNQAKDGKAGTYPGKRITVNAHSGEILKSEEGGISCGR